MKTKRLSEGISGYDLINFRPETIGIPSVVFHAATEATGSSHCRRFLRRFTAKRGLIRRFLRLTLRGELASIMRPILLPAKLSPTPTERARYRVARADHSFHS